MIGLSASPMPSAQNGWPQLDIEWAPASVPLDAPVWRSMIRQTDEVKAFRTKVGRPREYQRFQTGQANVTLGGWSDQYDPEYTGSPVYGMVLPNRQWRIVARLSGVTYYLFMGYIDGWTEPSGYPIEKEFSLSVSDAFKILGRLNLPTSMYELAAAPDGPQFWWRLDEPAGASVAADSGFSGAPAPGAYQVVTAGTAAIVAYDGGRTSATPGTAGFVSLPPTVIPTGATPTFSVELWFQIPAVATTNQVLFEMGASGRVLQVTMTGTSDAPTGRVRADLSLGPGLGATGTWDDGVAHHLVATYSPSGVGTLTGTLFIDGVQQSTSTTGTADLTASIAAIGGDPIHIGNLFANGAVSFTGKLAEVAIYSSALTATQVLAHYTAGANAFLNEATGTRVNRVLAYLAWPASKANVSTGNSTLQSADLPGGQAIDYFQTLYDTEQNYFYCDGLGRITWTNRHAAISATASTVSQATFTDASGAGGLHYATLIYDKNELDVYNDVTVTRNGGVPQRAVDLPSQKKYVPQSFALSGTLQVSDNDTNDCANWILAHHKDPPNRIIGITFEPLSDTNLMIQCLTRTMADRVTVIRTVGGTTISDDFLIEGIQHEASVTGKWVTTWWLNPADVQPYWILGDAVNSILGSTTRVAY